MRVGVELPGLNLIGIELQHLYVVMVDPKDGTRKRHEDSCETALTPACPFTGLCIRKGHRGRRENRHHAGRRDAVLGAEGAPKDMGLAP